MSRKKIDIPLDHFHIKLSEAFKTDKLYIKQKLVREYVKVYGGDPLDEATPVFLRIKYFHRIPKNSEINKQPFEHSLRGYNLVRLYNLISKSLVNVAYYSTKQIADFHISKHHDKKTRIEVEVIEL
jgi:hypothetical protein